MNTRAISKIEAARAQLDAAIELHFTSENFMAVHMLTAAAYNLLRDLAKHDGNDRPFLKSEWVNGLNEKEKRAALAFLNAPENFFKHANRDPNALLTEFNLELTEILLLDAIAYFKPLPVHERPKHYDTLLIWFGVPRVGLSEAEKSFFELARAVLQSQGKKAFWGLVVEREKR